MAKAIGVSESTVKRWCDRGVIESVRTAGGHRRLRTADVVGFLTAQGYGVVRPELLGLPNGMGRSDWSIRRAQDALTQLLVESQDESARRLLIDLFVAGHSVTRICDDVIAPAFHRIGDVWERGELAIYRERRCCEVALRLLMEIEQMIPAPTMAAPLAIGGTIEGDIYTLPVTMAGMVLKHLDWNTNLLGTNLPIPTMTQAVVDLRPQICWLSVSHLADQTQFIQQINQLFLTADSQGCAVVIGGRALSGRVRAETSAHLIAGNFRELEMFARSLHHIDSPPTLPLPAESAE
jgi:excisionase family DNA binding protein